MHQSIHEHLNTLYADIDTRVRQLVDTHAGRLRCHRGCSDCCIDDIAVHEIEAEHIRSRYPGLLSDGAPHEPGACAFLDGKNSCRIYPDRPYVCRTQGLPLHWIEESEDNTPVAMRDICPKNDAGTAVEGLPEEACWVIGPVEEELAKLQYCSSKGTTARVALRELFGRR